MMIHFIRPAWLLVLIPALIYLIWVIYATKQKNPWVKVCDAHLLPALLQTSAKGSQGLIHSLLFLFFVIAIFALAGPTWEKVKLPVYKETSALLVVLDLSSAMQSNDLKPDRLSRAKYKIRDLIKASPNTQMGLVVFSREAFVVSPLTQDANTLNALLDELSPQMMPVSGSDIGQGLAQSLALLKQTKMPHSNILLITASEPTASTWLAAKAISASGNRLNILAMLEANLTTQTVLDHLRQLAQMGGGGLYVFTPNETDIRQIMNSNTTMFSIKDDNLENSQLWQDAGPWFCLLLIPVALLVLREKIL
jgi:Ca-activated chloride channel family protein